jgi:hypothetical protein
MDDHTIVSWLTEPVRAWLYRVLVAAGALLLVYGVLSAEEAAAWTGLAVALCNVTPAAHTSTTP